MFKDSGNGCTNFYCACIGTIIYKNGICETCKGVVKDDLSNPTKEENKFSSLLVDLKKIAVEANAALKNAHNIEQRHAITECMGANLGWVLRQLLEELENRDKMTNAISISKENQDD